MLPALAHEARQLIKQQLSREGIRVVPFDGFAFFAQPAAERMQAMLKQSEGIERDRRSDSGDAALLALIRVGEDDEIRIDRMSDICDRDEPISKKKMIAEAVMTANRIHAKRQQIPERFPVVEDSLWPGRNLDFMPCPICYPRPASHGTGILSGRHSRCLPEAAVEVIFIGKSDLAGDLPQRILRCDQELLGAVDAQLGHIIKRLLAGQLMEEGRILPLRQSGHSASCRTVIGSP